MYVKDRKMFASELSEWKQAPEILWSHSCAKLSPPDQWTNEAAVLSPKHLRKNVNICIVGKVFALAVIAVIYRYQYSCLSENQ